MFTHYLSFSCKGEKTLAVTTLKLVFNVLFIDHTTFAKEQNNTLLQSWDDFTYIKLLI